MLRIWRLFYALPLRLRSLWKRNEVERELQEEFEHYVEERTALEIEKGRSPGEAREIALRALGGRTQRMEDCREARGVNGIENILRDLRYGARSWKKSPGVWMLATVALGLGIGANSTIFSLVDVIFERPLAGLDPERHVILRAVNERQGRNGNSVEDFLAWKGSGEFEMLAATRRVERVLLGVGEAERIGGQEVSPDLFRLFSARPALGRFPVEKEFHEASNKVLVLSHGAWRNRFGGRSDIVGQTVRMDDAVYTIVGVAPEGFWFPDARAMFWGPLSLDSGANSSADRSLMVLGRLPSGAKRARTVEALKPISAELGRRSPSTHEGWSVRVKTLFEGFYGANDEKTIYFLYIISGGVLLICCGNVVNLLIARGLARSREMCVRAALGASRARLFGQSLTEGLLLALPASVVALAVAQAAAGLILRSMQVPFPIPENYIDGRVLAVNGIAAILSIFVFGLYPAWKVSREPASMESRAGLRTTDGPSARRFSTVMVAAQAAFSLAIVIAAVVALRGTQILFTLNPGYDRSNVVRVELEPPRSRYPERADFQRFFGTLAQELQAHPEIQSFGFITAIPGTLRGDGAATAITSSRRMLPFKQQPTAHFVVATPGAIETLRIPIRQGRTLESRDNLGAQKVALVNQKLCEVLLAGADPVGESVVLEALGAEPFRIVGVYPNLLRDDVKAAPVPQLILSQEQVPHRSTVLVARSANTSGSAEIIRRATRSVDAEAPVAVSTLQADAESDINNSMVVVKLIAALAGLALFLAGCGLFALVSQNVSQRLPEIGVRLALGASAGSVRSMIVYSGLRLVAVGVLLGIVGGVLTGKLISSQMVLVEPTDWTVLAPAIGMFLVVAVSACVGPARRAVRADVIKVLRQD